MADIFEKWAKNLRESSLVTHQNIQKNLQHQVDSETLMGIQLELRQLEEQVNDSLTSMLSKLAEDYGKSLTGKVIDSGYNKLIELANLKLDNAMADVYPQGDVFALIRFQAFPFSFSYYLKNPKIPQSFKEEEFLKMVKDSYIDIQQSFFFESEKQPEYVSSLAHQFAVKLDFFNVEHTRGKYRGTACCNSTVERKDTFYKLDDALQFMLSVRSNVSKYIDFVRALPDIQI